MQPADVSELFARDSAITVSGGAGPAKRIHVFGLEQSNLAVTVDGVPQGPTSWHHTGSNVIDPAFLKSVEVEAAPPPPMPVSAPPPARCAMKPWVPRIC